MRLFWALMCLQLKPFFIITVLLVLLIPISSWCWETEIQKVHDGDIIEVTRKGNEVDVRLYGIDCPEEGQFYGMESKHYVQKNYRGKTFEVQSHGRNPKDASILTAQGAALAGSWR